MGMLDLALYYVGRCAAICGCFPGNLCIFCSFVRRQFAGHLFFMKHLLVMLIRVLLWLLLSSSLLFVLLCMFCIAINVHVFCQGKRCNKKFVVESSISGSASCLKNNIVSSMRRRHVTSLLPNLLAS
ncbi:hypothetical protein Droror1_Dr00025917 [Drosera rotundifolia]